MRKERDAPFMGIEPGGAGDELADFACVLAAALGMAGHEFATFGELGRIPVGTDIAAFAHGVKAHDRPVWHVRVEAVVEVFAHVRLPFRQFGRVDFAAGLDAFCGSDPGGGVFFFFRVLCPLGHGEVAINGIQNVGSQSEVEALFKGAGVVEAGGQEHEPEVCLRADDGEGDELGFFRAADVCQGGGEVGQTLAFLFGGKGCPEAVIDIVEEVLHDPSLLRDQGSAVRRGVGGGGVGGIGHGACGVGKGCTLPKVRAGSTVHR